MRPENKFALVSFIGFVLFAIFMLAGHDKLGIVLFTILLLLGFLL